MTAASPLSSKQSRSIDYALSQLSSVKSFTPIRSIEDLRKATFGHELQLADHRIVYLSEHGMEQVRLIVQTLHEADPFEGLAGYSDLWMACWKTLEELFSNGQIAENANALFALISERVRPQIQSRTFVVPFIGIELTGIDDLSLGSMKLLRPSVKHLDEQGVDHAFADIQRIIQRYRHGELWLTGTVRGTQRIAETRFRILSDLFAGLLAVAAASTQTSGATRLFISANMTGHDSHGNATWFFWDESNSGFGLHRSGIRGVSFPINEDLREQLTSTSALAPVMQIFESETRTPLQEAVVRGFHWFADAHRDSAPVMQFVKYWSCIETFFSTEQKDITRSLSVGTAAVLVFGGYAFIPVEDYFTLKQRIARLYALRSRAVHRASRNHITEADVGELSRYVAQLLINAVSFVERGYRTPDEIKRHSERLDKKLEQGRDSSERSTTSERRSPDEGSF